MSHYSWFMIHTQHHSSPRLPLPGGRYHIAFFKRWKGPSPLPHRVSKFSPDSDVWPRSLGCTNPCRHVTFKVRAYKAFLCLSFRLHGLLWVRSPSFGISWLASLSNRLFGLTCSQMAFYFRAYPDDPRFLKLLVSHAYLLYRLVLVNKYLTFTGRTPLVSWVSNTSLAAQYDRDFHPLHYLVSLKLRRWRFWQPHPTIWLLYWRHLAWPQQ